MNVEEFVDLHVHIGPEVLPRKYTVPGIVEAERGEMAGLALKNHFYPTTSLIETAETTDELHLVGSVTLNNYVGGLNPDAVYATALLTDLPSIVWFPTLTIDNFVEHHDWEIPVEWLGFAGVEEGDMADLDWVRPVDEIDPVTVTDDDGELVSAAVEVIDAVAENDCVLATGHVAWEDGRTLVEAAVRRGVESVIVTHPIWEPIDMPVEVQAELGTYDGVYLEQNFAMHHIDDVPMERIASQIDHVGPENCIVSSDVGQKTSPDPSEAMARFADELLARGLSEREIETMAVENPRTILGVD
ncbi:MAG: DUF6282 family protein [Haloarculaceae archaeon]